MSSTNRGGKRRPHDAYNTPSWVTGLLLREVIGEGVLARKTVLDPGAGEGAILVEVLRREPRAVVRGIEIQPADVCVPHPDVSRVIERASFLAASVAPVDVVIMNPPFSLALEFTTKALEVAPVVYALLRHGFTRSAARWDFIEKHLACVNMLPQRPSFVVGEKSETDSCDYDWLCFTREKVAEKRVRLLSCLPREERKRWELPRGRSAAE